MSDITTSLPPDPVPDAKDPLIERPFTRGNVIDKWLRDKGWKRNQLAKKAGVTRNSVTNLLNDKVKSDDDTVQKVLVALDRNEEQLHALLNRVNGKTVVPFRSPETRERKEDLDKHLRDAVQWGHRIADLPRDAYVAIFNIILALENAYRKR